MAAAVAVAAGAAGGLGLLVGPLAGAAWLLAGRPSSPGPCPMEAVLECVVSDGLGAMGAFVVVMLLLLVIAAATAVVGAVVLTVGLVRLLRRPALDGAGAALTVVGATLVAPLLWLVVIGLAW